MIYTEDRETFERDMFRPPFMARMLEMAGRYARCHTGRLSSKDKGELFEAAVEKFWELALKAAATSRERWLVWSQVRLNHVWVPGKSLGTYDAFFSE